MYINTNNFDLIDAQELVREMKSPKELFETWEGLSYSYLRREISSYMLDEMRTSIWKQFRVLRPLRPRSPKQGNVQGSLALV